MSLQILFSENLKSKSCSISLVKPTKDGKINPDSIKKLISKKTKLISVMFANNELGSINDIAKISKIAKIPLDTISHKDVEQDKSIIDLENNLKTNRKA